MTAEQKDKARGYFEAYPKEAVIHETSDGQVFLQTNHADAVNHQRRLTEANPMVKLTTYFKKDLDKLAEQEEEDEHLRKLRPDGASGQEEDEGEEEEDGDLSEEDQAFMATVPNASVNKTELIRWLNLHGEEVDASLNKDALLSLVTKVANAKQGAGN